MSVETSLKSENAKQGSGVIIRVGDRMTTFDHDAEGVLHAAAHRIGEHTTGTNFKTQRALMGAGGCEASAFKAYGYRVTGTSFPLGAWHNAEDDGSIVPEYIHKNDFLSGVTLITEAMRDDAQPTRNPSNASPRNPPPLKMCRRRTHPTGNIPERLSPRGADIPFYLCQMSTEVTS